MQQNELASLLDISTAMVSRLVKRGMPTDTLERAERWRKRHLEPGRVKGSRAGTVKKKPHQHTHPASPAPCASVQPAPTPAPQHVEAQGVNQAGNMSQDRNKAAALAGPTSLAVVELWSHATRHAQTSGAAHVGEMVEELRALLRRLPPDVNPRMALGVWLALTDYATPTDAELRQATDLDTLLDPREFTARLSLGGTEFCVVWLDLVACDSEGCALNGWPAGWDDVGDD